MDRKGIGSFTILVSHSGKQYVHRIVEALLIGRFHVVFCSPIWFRSMPRWLNIIPGRFQRMMRAQISKRYFSFSKPLILVQNYYLAIWKEIKDKIERHRKDDIQFLYEVQHDLFAADQVKKRAPKIVVGFEISSCSTFEEARKRGTITILDLAQIHFNDIITIAYAFPEMSYLLENPRLREINERKKKEYNLADYILTLSSFARQSLIANGIDPGKIIEANLGFDASVFAAKQSYSVNGTLKLMICGTEMVRKGLMLLLRVVAQLANEGMDLRLTIIGPRHEITRCLRAVHEIDSKLIDVVGFLSHDDLVSEYQKADVFVFPSYLDSWAMTVIEAMACGTPVIVTENTGSKDAVIKGGGMVIRPGDELALKNAISHYYMNRQKIETDGRIARVVAEQYTWRNYNDKWQTIIDTVNPLIRV